MSYLNLKGKKIAIIGSRSITDKKLVFDFLDRNRERIKLLVSGGANGPDSFAQEWAREKGFPILIFYPRWRAENGEHNRGAGFQRNRQIVEQADIVVAFYDGVSRGTAHSLEMAKELGKPVKIVSFSRELDPGERVAANIHAQMEAANREPTDEQLKAALQTHCDTTKRQLERLQHETL